jgi:hypothetical protein
MTQTQMPEILSRFHQRERAIGRAERGAEDILTILSARGIIVSAEIRQQILACHDLRRLNAWLKRALTATTASDVIAA